MIIIKHLKKGRVDMDNLDKTATQIMAEMEQPTSCCAIWKAGVNGIRIAPLGRFEPEKTYALAMEKLLKFQIGNFCPVCGNKL